MKRRVGTTKGGASSDLLVCFPTKTHLTLMPKPICNTSSPTKISSPNNSKKHYPPSLFKTNLHNNSRPKFNETTFGSDIASEPTSPKVTCAGQIKVGHKQCHVSRTVAKSWIEALGLKKDVTNFIGALRSTFRINMQCFGAFRGAVDYLSDDEEDDDQEDVDANVLIFNEEAKEVEGNGKSMFSKWLMVLEEEQGKEVTDQEDEENEEANLPPNNALLLMRCRSVPSTSKMREEEKEKELTGYQEGLMLMSYAPDFFKVSTDIAKETWVVEGVDPYFARSRSWRR